MTQEIIIVDAFAERPFAGNQAAICVAPEPREDAWMQSVAAEMNLSETAFLWRQDEVFRLRWFTPTVEVDLCGHATLAAAHVLWSEKYLDFGTTARFATNSGLLTADYDDGWIRLDFPSEPEAAAETPAQLAEALGVTPVYVGRNRMDLLAEVESEEVLKSITPDFRLLAEIPVRGVIVTAASASGDFDFLSRFFAPNCGVNEDPVCGSAHCCLAPHWSTKLGKSDLLAYQASSRGGVLRLRLNADRVELSGRAFTTLRGQLTV